MEESPLGPGSAARRAAVRAQTSMQAEQPAPFPDWSSIFPDSSVLVPPGQEPEFKVMSPSVVRGVLVDLNASLAPLLEQRDDRYAPVEIHADVLRLSAPLLLSVRSLTIHARRIEVFPGASLTLYNRTKAATFDCQLRIDAGEIVAEEATAALHIDFLGVEQIVTAGDAPCHLWLDCALDGAGQDVVATLPSNEIAPGDPLLGEFELLVAKRLQYTPTDSTPDPIGLGLRMARWVNRCHARPGGNLRLTAESAVVIERLRGAQRRLHAVPYLRLAEYHDLAKDVATALQSVDQQAMRFFDRDASIVERRAAAQDMLTHYQHATQYSQKLLAQARTEMEESQKARESSAAKLDAQQNEITAARTRFEAGVEAKRREAEREATWAVIGAVVTVGIGVAVACTGNPAGAAAAVGAAKGAKDVAEQLGRLKQIIERIAKAIDAIKKIVAALEALKKVYDFVSGNVQTWAKTEEFKKLREQTDPGESLTAADWDVFCVDMRSLFKSPIEMGIDGAQEYLDTLEKVAIRGKDAIDTGFHFAACARQYQQRLFEIERDQADFVTVRARIGELDSKRGPDLSMMMFYERLRNQLKLQLIEAIDHVGDGFRYYALREPSQAPSINSTTAELQALLATAKLDLARAKETFLSPPGSWGPKGVRIWGRAAIEKLKSERKLSWTISSSNFLGFDRIRLAEIRVWLVGEDSRRGPTRIGIATSGIYRDRMAGRSFEFATAPLFRKFEYRRVAESQIRNHRGEPVEITAKADDVEQSFFEPTPFTTWEISVPESVRLENVTEVALQFFGTYIASPLLGAAVDLLRSETPIAEMQLDVTIL